MVPTRCCSLLRAGASLESCARADEPVKAPKPISTMKTPIVQRAKASKTRNLKAPDSEAGFFFIWDFVVWVGCAGGFLEAVTAKGTETGIDGTPDETNSFFPSPRKEQAYERLGFGGAGYRDGRGSVNDILIYFASCRGSHRKYKWQRDVNPSAICRTYLIKLTRQGRALPERDRTMVVSPALMVASSFTSERKLVASVA